MSAESKKEKLKMSRLFSNVKFILSLIWKMNKKCLIVLYGGFALMGLLYSLYSSLFLKYLIEMLQDKAVDLRTVCIFIGIGCGVLVVAEIIETSISSWAEYQLTYVVNCMQKQFVKKASEMDLMCYDNKEYYDDFIVAASQAEEMLVTAVLSTSFIVSQSVSIVILATVIFTLNPWMALFPVLGFLVNIVTRFRITDYEYRYDTEYKRIMRKADYSKRVFYQPEYAKEIKLSDIRTPLNRQFDAAIDETMEEAKKIGIKIAVLSLINWISVFTFFSNFCPPVCLGYLALVKKSIRLGDVAALNNSQSEVRNMLDGFNYAAVMFQKVGQFAEKFRCFMDYEVNIEHRMGTKEIPKQRQCLQIKDMSFRYAGAKSDTLKHINMTIKPGEKVAFVGENGAGKTTFVKLLMNLYDVTQGSIEYGGEDIRNYGTKEYRKIIGAVFQDYQLYGATLAENVKMNAVNKEDYEEIREALKLADFESKLNRLPNGLDTNMTREFEEDGTMLSGGEAQKVAISRMFAKAGELAIAILDEPSSALDPIAEYTLNTNMMKQTKDATIIFISHRLSTTKDADRIYMFEHGEIVEQGTHEELMALGGEYAFMFEKQAHYYQEELEEETILPAVD